MDIFVKKFRYSILVFILAFTAACDVLPGDLFPKPPTLISGASPTVSASPPIDQVTPTAPGFPTLPVTETLVLPVDTETLTPTTSPADTLRPTEPSIPAIPTHTPRPEPFFLLQPGSPQPLVNIAKPESGCNWMGIGGQIFDLQGTPLLNYLVQVEGELANEHVSVLGLTGGALQLGPGGYLLEIATQPIESSGMLYLQVLDLSGRILTDKTFITTYSDCDKNLILVNFIQLPPDLNYVNYLPEVNK